MVGLDHSVGQPFRRELKRLAGVLGLADRFLWLDWLEDTAPFFAAIDVFVSPSHSESFGLAILEAMARGKAVAATETDGAGHPARPRRSPRGDRGAGRAGGWNCRLAQRRGRAGEIGEGPETASGGKIFAEADGG